MSNARVEVAMGAFAVAMKAIVNDLPAQDIEIMLTKAEQLLDRNDKLFTAIVEFVTQCEVTEAGDGERLAALGRMLRDGAQNALTERRDLFDGF